MKNSKTHCFLLYRAFYNTLAPSFTAIKGINYGRCIKFYLFFIYFELHVNLYLHRLKRFDPRIFKNKSDSCILEGYLVILGVILSSQLDTTMYSIMHGCITL